MLGIDRRAAHYVWTAVVVVVGIYLVYLVRKTVFVFIVAMLFAYLLSPLVNLLVRFLPFKRTRTPAMALAYILFVAIVVVFVSQVGSRIGVQARELSRDLPSQIAAWQKPNPALPPTLDHLRLELLAKLREEISTRAGELISALPQASLRFLTVASDLIYVVIVPILSFFFLKDAGVMRGHILDLVDPGPRRELLDDVLADMHLLLAHYMRALFLLALSAFTAYAVALTLLGVPYGILLAALGGLLEFIPMVGPLAAALCSILVALIGGASVAGVLIFIVAFRMLQDYILSPHLMEQGVALHPLLVLFGVFAGSEIAGIPGTFLSVPVLALVRILYVRIRRVRLGVTASPVKPVAP